MSTPQKICIVLTTRGNYAKMKSTLLALHASDSAELQLVVGGALLDKSYGNFIDTIKNDGFVIDHILDYLASGGTPSETAHAAGTCTVNMASILDELRPDVIMIIADRYESLSIAHAALCMNVIIAHLEGGEVSGSIDERIRHAITKLAHIHFPASDNAAARLRRLGEHEDSIYVVGTPSLDQIRNLELNDTKPLQEHLNNNAKGATVDLELPYLVVSQHSVVTEYNAAMYQFQETAEAILKLEQPTIWILPNDDAGGTEAHNVITSLQQHKGAPAITVVGGLDLKYYMTLLYNAQCLIGNTSSGIREGAFIGVPTVNVGSRQNCRQRGQNVIDVAYSAAQIVKAAQHQIAQGRYPSDTVYGNGLAGVKIAGILEGDLPLLDKTIIY